MFIYGLSFKFRIICNFIFQNPSYIHSGFITLNERPSRKRTDKNEQSFFEAVSMNFNLGNESVMNKIGHSTMIRVLINVYISIIFDVRSASAIGYWSQVASTWMRWREIRYIGKYKEIVLMGKYMYPICYRYRKM